MEEAMKLAFANPSSVHGAGRVAGKYLTTTRRALADAVSCRASEVILTAGGTEAVNAGVFGLPAASMITTTLEHPAVRESVHARGLPVETLAVSSQGAFLTDLADALERLPAPALVALQWVNHEVGAVFPIREVTKTAAEHEARVFVDASQALGKVEVDLKDVSVDAVAFASHKIGGPAGAGALVVRRGVPFEARTFGGGQERGRRAGSLDPVAHAGFGAACRAVGSRLEAMVGIAARRDRLERALVHEGARVNRADLPRVATVTNVSVPSWRGDVLVAALDVEGLCVASGAACSSGVAEPSAVIRALFENAADRDERAASALRVSIGPETTDEEVSAASAIFASVLPRQRG